MRKHIILLLIVCLHLITARGQTIEELDLSGLPQPTQAKALRYWFDDDVAGMQTISQISSAQTLDVSLLTEGLHTVHLQVVDNEDHVSYVKSGVFVKVDNHSEVSSVRSIRYWFDDEANNVSIAASSGTHNIDASMLHDGLHTIHYQVMGIDGSAYYVASAIFIKMSANAAEAVSPKQLLYWFDDETAIQNIDVSGDILILDASELTEGLHTIHYQVLCSNGQMTPAMSSLFMRMNDGSEATFAKSLRYWFDDDATTVKLDNISNGSQTLDVSTLTAGLHTLNYQLIDNEGKVGVPVTRLFFKDFEKTVADGENRITKYQYWLNTNTEAVKTVELATTANPYALIALLPMQKESIHSDCFHFELTNGVPTIYAKNIFYIRFHDAEGYFSDGNKPFVDYSVKLSLTDIEHLESGDRATTDKPVKDVIKWYSLEAEPGDSLQFRLDHAAAIQLFSPSGDEVYSASGSQSVNWGGCHARESGTFYLALHDVTAHYGNTVSIDYNHIDKYAVLRQDVSVVGNGGCSTITFEGNGFRDLFAVDLFTENGDSIHHVYIGHESDATTSVVFDFTDAPLGTYHAKFRFAEEDKVFTKLVTVEEARDIELATTVTYPSRFLRGTSATFTIKITNKGNMTAYAVPIEIQLLTQNLEAISEIKLSDNAPMLDLSWPNMTDIPLDSIQILMDYIRSKGDMLHFINAYDSIDGRYFKDAHFAIEIAPLSTYVLSLTIKSGDSVEIQTLTPSIWNSCSTFSDKSRSHRRITKEDMCCIREKIECLMNVIVSIFDFASIFPQAKLADCVASLGNTTLQFAYDVWCGEEFGGKNARKAAEDLVWDAINGLVGCLIPGGEKWEMLSNIQWLYQHIYDNISTAMDCAKALTEEIPNCPPHNNTNGGKSDPVNSFDPNEIYGYTAESGSYAIKDSKTDVYYTIQFENDTTFATAAAHNIWLTDTLDASKFDLSTFKPTRIKIGEKSEELKGDKNFVTTVDMRPEINAIAQVEGTFDQKKGIAKWHINSLDPMTMEPTDDVMQGVLPVNVNGNGIGELSFDISLKPGLTHGTEINNRAGIVFDKNETIMTPYWTNIIDRIAPESRVSDVILLNDSTAAVSIEASDELSGPWRYDVYVQYGVGSAWWKAAENVPIDSMAQVKFYEGIDHGFYVVVTDSAGNVEQKEAAREFSLRVGEMKMGDANGDGVVDVADVVAIVNYILEKPAQYFNKTAADVNGDEVIDAADVVLVVNIILDKGSVDASRVRAVLRANGFLF